MITTNGEPNIGDDVRVQSSNFCSECGEPLDIGDSITMEVDKTTFECLSASEDGTSQWVVKAKWVACSPECAEILRAESTEI